MNKKGVIHFSAAPDFSLLSTSGRKELLFGSVVGAMGDVGGCGDMGCAVGGGCAVVDGDDVDGGANIGDGIDVGGNDEFSKIDGAAL